MKCLILGGAGFLGSHLCDALLTEGHEVRIFDKANSSQTSHLQNPAIEWLVGDFSEPDALVSAMDGREIIFHLVCTTLPKTSNDDPVFDTESNVVSTLRLLNVACRSNVQKLIFASSGGTVYGIPNEIPIKESHPTDPVCSYGISKLVIEKYLHLYHVLHGLNYCVLRLANPYGERQRVASAQGAVTVFLHRALTDRTIEIWGDGSIVRDYIYAGDVAMAFLRAMSYDGAQRVFNVGSGSGQSVNEILAEIESLLGRSVARAYTPGRAFDVPVNVLDISRAGAALDWQPKTPFSEGLARTLCWMQNQLSHSA